MSDHVDGPRSIGDPSADLTDLFAFTSPENPARTVLAACVFPAAGEHAIFSNVVDHSIVVRRVTVGGVGAEGLEASRRVFIGQSHGFHRSWDLQLHNTGLGRCCFPDAESWGIDRSALPDCRCYL